MNRNISVLLVCLENVAMMVCWTLLAIHFEKWWIALFAILCFTTLKWKPSGNNTKEN